MMRVHCLLAIGTLSALAADAPQATEFFEKQVRPCSQPAAFPAMVRPSSFHRSASIRARRFLKAEIAGHPSSLATRVSACSRKPIRHDGLKMPVGGKLKRRRNRRRRAVDQHRAPFGRTMAQRKRPPALQASTNASRKSIGHSSRCARRNPEPDYVDSFIFASLAKAGLKLSESADRQTLIRRLSFVLTGLPPTPLETDLFLHDQSPGAYERLVDRLLASPHFGEHWARHWMDVMRFAETFGNDWNYEINGAWLYRDYLIRAFNQDVPYNQLVREHLAGDLLEKPRLNAKEGINESVIGTAFERLGELGHDDCIRFRQIRTDVVDNQIDTLGKAFLGLTIACARCHDHKLDPIPTADYYALYGVLTSSRMVMRNADLPTANAAAKQRMRELKPLIRAELAKGWIEESAQIPRYMMAANRAWKGLPPTEKDLADLSLDRVQAWLTLLEKNKPAMEDPLYP